MHNPHTNPGVSGRTQNTRAAVLVIGRGVWGVSTVATTAIIRVFAVVHSGTQIGQYRRERDKSRIQKRKNRVLVLWA